MDTALSCRPPVKVPGTDRWPPAEPTPNRTANRLEHLAHPGVVVGSNALLDGARPDDGSGASDRGPSEAIGDQAKDTRGEQKAHVTHRGNADDLLVHSEYTRHDEVVGARDDR